MIYIIMYTSLLAHQCLQDHQRVSSTMNVKISLLFFVTVAVYAKAELEQQYHPQAVLHYLEMEDKKMAEKVRSIVKLQDEDPARPSFRPSRFPTGIPPKVVSTTFTCTIKSSKARANNVLSYASALPVVIARGYHVCFRSSTYF